MAFHRKADEVSGIYIITNLKTKKYYIGQAGDLGMRWRRHIFKGQFSTDWLDLYKDMRRLGLEWFTFGIMEVCPEHELDKKEKAWIKLYLDRGTPLYNKILYKKGE